MKVSIITPYYNGSKFIEDAVQSVLAQSYGNFEMLIINDASPDNPNDLLHELQARDARIKVYQHEENKGIAAARNTAIKSATGELFALLDQDDMWLPEKLQIQVDEFSKNREVGLVFSNYYRTDESGKIRGQGEKSHKIIGEDDEKTLINLFNKNRITACTVAFRKDCINTLGAFREDIKGGTDDYEMWLRIAGKYRLKYIDLPLVKRRSHGNNTSGRFREEGILDHLLIVEDICKLYPLLNKYKLQRVLKIYHHLARYYLETGRSEEARTYFKKMLSQSPYSVEPYIGILKSYFM